MKCSACGVRAEFEDGFCSACGVEQPASRLPVKRQPAPLPAVWKQAAPVVARGAALVAAGIAAEWLLRALARGTASSPAPKRRPAAKTIAVPPREAVLVEEIVAVSRTVVRRRVIARK